MQCLEITMERSAAKLNCGLSKNGYLYYHNALSSFRRPTPFYQVSHLLEDVK